MASTFKGYDPELGKKFLQESGGLVIGGAATSARQSGASTPASSAAPPQTTARLPPAPTREQFPGQEESEEALGFWQGHVGRIRAMADKGRTLERLPARVGGDGTLVVFVGFKPAQDAAACMAEAGLAYESPRPTPRSILRSPSAWPAPSRRWRTIRRTPMSRLAFKGGLNSYVSKPLNSREFDAKLQQVRKYWRTFGSPLSF